jgi:DNA replication protein DnaC
MAAVLETRLRQAQSEPLAPIDLISCLVSEELARRSERLLLDGTRKELLGFLVTVPLLIIDDLGMRKLPLTAAEELLEIIMRRYERASTVLTSNRPVEDWGKLLGDAAAVSAMLDRLLHHGHVLKCGPRSWRTKTDLPLQEAAG